MPPPRIAAIAVLVALLLAAAGGASRPMPREPGFAAQGDTVTRKYEVRLAFTGYTGLAESEDCRALVDLQGYDSLVGVVAGIEGGDPGDGVMYTGRLRRVTRMDYCLARGGDEAKWCVVRLTGAARMLVQIEVYGEEGRGAWLKADPDTVPAESIRAEGDCDPADTDEVRAGYPGGSSGGTPDGQPIAEPDPALLFVNGVPRLRPGYLPADEAQGGWALRVVREVR